MAHENGQNGIRPDPAMAYAKAYNVDAGWILTGLGAGPTEKVNVAEAVTTPHAEYNPDRWPMDLRILGAAECGPDGLTSWNGEVIGMTGRPPALAGAAQAYAIYVAGDSMEPRYFAGELVYINPGRPVEVGSFVLVQLRPADGDPTPKAVLKRLVRRSATKLQLEQFNPRKTIEFKTADVVSVHRVVGSLDA